MGNRLDNMTSEKRDRRFDVKLETKKKSKVLHRDYLRNEIEVGDKVLYIDFGRNKIYKTKIERLTNQKAKVEGQVGLVYKASLVKKDW